MRSVAVHVRALVLAIAACAPSVDAPADRQRAVDRDDAARLDAQLAALPGAISAHSQLHRAIVDPLAPSRASATAQPAPSSAAIEVIVDDHADRAAITAAARALVRGVAPDIADPQIVVEVGAIRPELARVGPFTVEASSRRGLIATLAVALIAIAGLGLALAAYARRGSSAQ